jgi:hypothetical protein
VPLNQAANFTEAGFLAFAYSLKFVLNPVSTKSSIRVRVYFQ